MEELEILILCMESELSTPVIAIYETSTNSFSLSKDYSAETDTSCSKVARGDPSSQEFVVVYEAKATLTNPSMLVLMDTSLTAHASYELQTNSEKVENVKFDPYTSNYFALILQTVTGQPSGTIVIAGFNSTDLSLA